MKREIYIKFYQTYKLIIFPVIIIISALILIIFIIYPQTAKLITNSKLEAQFRAKSQFLDAKAQTLENYDETDLSRKVDYALSSLPTDKDFVTIIGLLQKLTDQTGFKIVSLSLGQTSADKSDAQSYQVKLEITGPKVLLPTLVKNIESSIRIMRVSSIEVSSSRDASAVSTILGIDVLFSTIPNNFGTIDSPLPELTSKDEELLAKLATNAPTQAPVQVGPSGPRGKANPFE